MSCKTFTKHNVDFLVYLVKLLPNLFLDIETAPEFTREEYSKVKDEIDSGKLHKNSHNNSMYWKFERGGLSPFNGKVILITYRINNAHIFRLKEWEMGEKGILEKFYNVVDSLHKGGGDDRLRIVGHNILRFDLFFLYQRMIHHSIRDEYWLHQQILNRPDVIDFLQMHLPLNKFKIKGLKHDVLAHAYGFPAKSTSGSDEILHYFQGDYDKIVEYSEREFIYPELYEKMISHGMITAEKLQESITHYNKHNQ